jgi:hypothetical protein
MSFTCSEAAVSSFHEIIETIQFTWGFQLRRFPGDDVESNRN